MLLTIAWRNIWRNKRRSLIVITSVVVGMIAILYNDALSIGMVTQIFENQIGSHVAYIQIHRKGFNDNKVIQTSIDDPDSVKAILQQNAGILSFSQRVVTFGLLSSALNSSGGMIVGVEPDKEQRVTTIKRSIVHGHYLTGAKHEVVIGQRLAGKLGVGLGDKVVGMASTMNGSVGSDLFRVVGIFETASSEFDKSYMYISLANAQEMLEMGKRISEFAIITKQREQVETVKNELAKKLGERYEVLSYADLMPLMLSQIEIYKESLYIVYLIVGLAMIFGIINTMLMSVYERIQEFGVLMAIGMKNSRLFSMVLAEALFLGTVGAAIGMLIGYGLYIPLSTHGINLSMFSDSLSSFGVGSVIYPVLSTSTIVETLIVVPLIAMLGALYPALKAVRLVPINAIRYV
jgi:putative ABC transport system permease protein